MSKYHIRAEVDEIMSVRFFICDETGTEVVGGPRDTVSVTLSYKDNCVYYNQSAWHMVDNKQVTLTFKQACDKVVTELKSTIDSIQMREAVVSSTMSGLGIPVTFARKPDDLPELNGNGRAIRKYDTS